MPSFNQKSKDKLETCHPDLQKIFNEVIKHVDCTILEGMRSKDRQEELVHTGRSTTMNSKHLCQSDGYSHAVDVALCPVDWTDREKFILFAGFVKGIATSLGIELRVGVDWNGNFNVKEHKFFDGPHFELVIK